MLRCAEITGANLPLRIVERPRLTTPPSGLIVKTTHAGICHSDLHIISDHQDLGFSKFLGDKYVGTVLGHEVAGIIEEFGEDVNPQDYGLAVGDRVAIYPWIRCMKCGPCKIGYNNRCSTAEDSLLFIGLGRYPGGYGTHVQVPSPAIVFKVPDKVPMQVACLLPCSGGTAFDALQKTRERLQYAYKARPDQAARLLIVGAGGLGLWALQLASKAIPGVPLNITVADINEAQLKIARDAGADETLLWSPSGNEDEDVKQTISKGLIDAAIDFVGTQRTSEVAVKTLGSGGALVLVGLGGGVLQVSIPVAISNEISIHGNYVLELKTLKELLDIMAQGDVKYDNVELVKLDDINEVLDRLRKGKIRGRAVIQY